MAWVCDYCGGPPDPWSGGQGGREFCNNPACPGSAGEPQEPLEETHEILTISIMIEKELLETGEPDLVAEMVAEDAGKIAKDSVLARMKGNLVDLSSE